MEEPKVKKKKTIIFVSNPNNNPANIHKSHRLFDEQLVDSQNVKVIKPLNKPTAQDSKEIKPPDALTAPDVAASDEKQPPEEPKRHYQRDGQKRIGEVIKAYLPAEDAPVTLVIRELGTSGDMKGYVADEYAIDGLYDNDRRRSFPKWYDINPYTYVVFERKVASDRVKADRVSQLELTDEKSFRRFHELRSNYFPSNDLYEALYSALKGVNRRLEPDVVHALLYIGTNKYEVGEKLIQIILRYHFEIHWFDDSTTKRLLNLALQHAAPFSDIYAFANDFFTYMSYLLDAFPDKKDVYYPANVSVGFLREKVRAEEILALISGHFNRDADFERICGITQCLYDSVLFDYPEFRPYASDKQLAFVDDEIKRWEEEKNRQRQERAKQKEEKKRQRAERDSILRVLEERGIEYFVHFTDVENIDGILEHGIMSVRDMNERNLSYKNTDEGRFDLYYNAISLSVSFPNYKMFYTKRLDEKNKERRWCVLLLNPADIIEMNCQFFSHNAASARFREDTVVRDTAKHFQELFDAEVKGKADRVTIVRAFPQPEASFLKYATSPQAEIMCFNTIPISCIKKCVFQSPITRNEYDRLKKSGISVAINRDYFGKGPYAHYETQEEKS